MHMRWPLMAEATPEMPGAHNPFEAEAEIEPLAWDTCIPYITKNSMFSSHVKLDGLGQETVQKPGGLKFAILLAIVAGGLAWMFMPKG